MGERQIEVAWLDGTAWAMQDDLPMGTEYGNQWHPEDDPLVMSPSKVRFHRPVAVFRWPGGDRPSGEGRGQA